MNKSCTQGYVKFQLHTAFHETVQLQTMMCTHSRATVPFHLPESIKPKPKSPQPKLTNVHVSPSYSPTPTTILRGQSKQVSSLTIFPQDVPCKRTTSTCHPPIHQHPRESYVANTDTEMAVTRWKKMHADPLAQTIILGLVCFLLPGMFNAINGLGAVGKADATITDNANTALAVTFAVCSLLAGGLFNLVGHRILLLVGGLTYILYIGSYLSYDAAFVITSGAILGIGAGFLWTAQGAIVISYPEEEKKGLYISVFWSIFNCGAIMGSIISVAIEWHNEVSQVSTHTYIAFMAIMAVGTLLTLLLLPPAQIQRADGSQVAEPHPVRVSTEAKAIVNLFHDWRLLCLAPMFLASNWFYTYQFNAVNGGGVFNTRTRGMNGTLYWVAQVGGSFLMGRLLDYKHAERWKRGICGLAVLLVASMAIWGGGYAFQETFSRASVKGYDRIDLADSGRYAGPVVLYTLFGFFDAIWQTYCYWIMGALSNETDVAARMSGFYKAVQNAGAACAGQVDAHRVSYRWELLINWVLLIVGALFAVPVALSLQNSSTSVKDLEGTGGDPGQEIVVEKAPSQ